jgi:hypothetical protein
MLSKCAHPACFAQFRYLHEGRIFKAHMSGPSGHTTTHRVEYFWLCERCAKSLTIVFESGRVTTHPIYLELTTGNSEMVAERSPTRRIA